ncbi:hypothetical protein SLEP1_g55823 [Rubroshorea leprosula]|uniref:Apple domain-containing protein n=1 Tax=Rubroshorea leprosula TaxID=152421 RepID=A0AAV5MGP0_9ROSI|nr:hypothetical protein SLEP1_g55823 [Rubroshorea leprosula]
MPKDFCDTYGRCGAYSYCDNTQLLPCQCLEGFEPKSTSKWSSMDWSRGCVRKKPLNRQQGDGFIQYQKLKLPDAAQSWISRSMNLKECQTKCWQNYSCTAYTSFDINGDGSGCAIWFGDLLDIRQFQIGGQDLYIRMSTSESGLFIVCYFFLKRKRSLEAAQVVAKESERLHKMAANEEGRAAPTARRYLGAEGTVKRRSKARVQGRGPVAELGWRGAELGIDAEGRGCRRLVQRGWKLIRCRGRWNGFGAQGLG